MRGNSFGNLFTLTSFGESHGPALGVVIDGVPAGLKVSLEDLYQQLERRRPGRLKSTTSRNEADYPEVLSGVFQGKTLGTPIAVLVRNKDQDSQAYEGMQDDYRPGHADKTTLMKFGIRDHRGGGRASGRETLCRVIAGYFASLIIPEVHFSAKITRIGPHQFLSTKMSKPSQLGLADPTQDESIEEYLLALKSKGESAGGEIVLNIKNCPQGLGEPVFDKLKADLSKAMLSIGSCMGVTFGLGEEFSRQLGSQISKDVTNFGGIEGGISNGEMITLKLFFKAPSTIGKKATEGRHDPCILPRVLPVVESMATIVIADHALRQNAFN
ncbi:MAG: chorismate synthase [Bacteriovoracaceae bacterium]|nr:chorismate synthase [Bacteriovoracaceae bacterium]